MEKSYLEICCSGVFLKLKVSFYFFPKEYYHVGLEYQVDSFVVSIFYISVLAFVIFELQLRFSVDVVIVNVPIHLEFVLTIKFSDTCCCLFYRWILYLSIEKIGVGRFWNLQWISFCNSSWVCIWFDRCFNLRKFSPILSVFVFIITFFSDVVFERESAVLCLLELVQFFRGIGNILNPEDFNKQYWNC